VGAGPGASSGSAAAAAAAGPAGVSGLNLSSYFGSRPTATGLLSGHRGSGVAAALREEAAWLSGAGGIGRNSPRPTREPPSPALRGLVTRPELALCLLTEVSVRALLTRARAGGAQTGIYALFRAQAVVTHTHTQPPPTVYTPQMSTQTPLYAVAYSLPHNVPLCSFFAAATAAHLNTYTQIHRWSMSMTRTSAATWRCCATCACCWLTMKSTWWLLLPSSC
jgi:hypothetical protein